MEELSQGVSPWAQEPGIGEGVPKITLSTVIGVVKYKSSCSYLWEQSGFDTAKNWHCPSE